MQRSSAAAAGHVAYFPRTLSVIGEPRADCLRDSEVLTIGRSVVVLGEPGMGKSELMKELGRQAGVLVVSAPRFIHSQDPTTFAKAGLLLIDGLDEAMGRVDSDAVDRVLAQLESAGCPRFVLSCRARDWQTRTFTGLVEIYGNEPLVVNLEELTRTEAADFWHVRGNASGVGAVLDGLDRQGLSDLYKNPLTLGLLGQVADSGRSLPSTRAELFEHVCELTWPEQGESRQSSRLGQIGMEQALSAAGAMMAAMILGGAEAISSAGPASIQEGDLAIADLERLPGADEARAVLASKLFRNIGVGRAAPIHRVVAEYLGARWLARQAKSSRSRRRLMTQFHGAGLVPSSLRGLHAWIAHHSPVMAPLVISADPFGLLRYGETSLLDATRASSLMDALEALAKSDPYFRAQDWDARSAKGLAQRNLAARIEKALADCTNNFHLRSLLLESIRDTALAAELLSTLQAIVLDVRRPYGEREDAIELIFSSGNVEFLRAEIRTLIDQSDSEDSRQLARRVVDLLAYDLPDALLVETLLSEIGFASAPTPAPSERATIRLRHYEELTAAISPERAKSLLREILIVINPGRAQGRDEHRELAELVGRLLLRALRGAQVSVSDVPDLWRWLGLAHDAGMHDDEVFGEVRKELKARTRLRRALQRHAIRHAKSGVRLRVVDYELFTRGAGLSQDRSDAAFFLNEMATKLPKTRRTFDDWSDLVSLGIRQVHRRARREAVRLKRTNDEVARIARALPGFTLRHEKVLRRVLHAPRPTWEARHRLMRDEYEAQRHAHRVADVRLLTGFRGAIRTGELRFTYNASKAYLGMLMRKGGDDKLPPEERLARFFDPALVDDFLTGFEATLHRTDLPELSEIARSHAERKVWNWAFPITAGALVQLRRGASFDSLPIDVRRKTLLILLQDAATRTDKDLADLRKALERCTVPSATAKQDLARVWIEPFFAARATAESELRSMAHLGDWSDVPASLAREWLTKFPHMSLSDEMELVSALARAGLRDQIVEIARLRDTLVYRDEDHALSWLSVDVAYRFDAVKSNLAGAGQEHPHLLWLLRDRLQAGRRGHADEGSLQALKWVVAEFRRQFPYATMLGSSVGDRNDFDASDFLRRLISRLGDQTSDEAIQLISELSAEPPDSYTDVILHIAAQQQQKRAEESFAPLSPQALASILSAGPPANIDDLRSLVLEELLEAQKVFRGDDLDQVRDFWDDANIPREENRCRDRLAAQIERSLMASHQVLRIPEADMPNTKRVDLAFAHTTMQLPMEVKGQWHTDVWDAANSQLAPLYLIDWRCDGRGIYCVLWFGDVPSATGRRLKPPPAGIETPATPEAMRQALVALIPASSRAFIDVVVLDLSSGRRDRRS